MAGESSGKRYAINGEWPKVFRDGLLLLLTISVGGATTLFMDKLTGLEESLEKVETAIQVQTLQAARIEILVGQHEGKLSDHEARVRNLEQNDD